MIKNWRCFFLMLVSVISFTSLQAQNLSNSFPDTTTAKDHYLKPSALIIPGTFLLYSALKPVVTGIQNIDDTIFETVLRNHAGFQTNTEDYLMWAPSASVYAIDAFKVKTKHSFKNLSYLRCRFYNCYRGFGLCNEAY